MIEKQNFYELQVKFVPEDCIIVKNVDFDDISDDGILLKSLLNRETEYQLTALGHNLDINQYNDVQQQIIRKYINDFDVFKVIGNEIYFELIVDSKSDPKKKYLIDLIVADLKDKICKNCQKSNYELMIIERRIRPDGSQCTRCKIVCPNCHTILHQIQFNAVLLFTDIACGLRYSDISVNGGFEYVDIPTPEVELTIHLPKKYFRC